MVRRHYRVTFYREVCDGCGRPHRLPLATYAIDDGGARDAAITEAVRKYESATATGWTISAHGIDCTLCDDVEAAPSSTVTRRAPRA
ncbi:hypothetical protein ABIE65_004706 [Constrictibacter sp. MBR-5]|jgi:hypothetical protein|uniref:hypothetical protein n=1 Tax=Constrictibacter sp. MBR-5 TaxID=3156467 RepID=UPI00339A3FF1